MTTCFGVGKGGGESKVVDRGVSFKNSDAYERCSAKPGLGVSRFDPAFSLLAREMVEHEMGPLFVSELKHVADRVVSAWPPEEYLYIGVGRSPSPLIEVLSLTDVRKDHPVRSIFTAASEPCFLLSCLTHYHFPVARPDTEKIGAVLLAVSEHLPENSAQEKTVHSD